MLKLHVHVHMCMRHRPAPLQAGGRVWYHTCTYRYTSCSSVLPLFFLIHEIITMHTKVDLQIAQRVHITVCALHYSY